MENNITDELEKITRRLNGLQKQLDLLNGDREIFETIQGRLTSLEEQWKLTRQHDHAAQKDLKEEVNIVGDKVKAAVESSIEGIQTPSKSRKRDKKSWWRKLVERR